VSAITYLTILNTCKRFYTTFCCLRNTRGIS